MTDSVKHLTQNDLANRWNKSVHTIERYRCEGNGPVYLKIGGKVMYRLVDIEAFEAKHRYESPKVSASQTKLNESGLKLHEAMKQLHEFT
ncbi:helix-turn-helix domain-containing protein [Zwartia panacis]|uniref:helix-turn-helix domain-containing protein n=1 Tax=Zwartia panacis TaxID=2683345 RepID=UPI0025B5D266|nr:helix-turn-helix domain-containing protein [Zwartia panacis]MDN4016126.1 helix-turn-helix domain-containing protein [Zwartia panacis]